MFKCRVHGFILVLLCFALVGQAEGISLKTFRAQPKLVVVVVFDQMRSDYLTRFHSRFLPAKSRQGVLGGFEALIAQGAYYPFAQQDIMQSMTCPGHAMILTGAYPNRMGIPLNNWFDAQTNQQIYCAEDGAHRIVGTEKPTTISHLGTSPKNLLGSTVGDELKNAGYDSKVVTIALKDRAAIMMGGHRADLAVWFDSHEFRWVSSSYYARDGKLPAWVTQTNDELKKQARKTPDWKPEGLSTGLSRKGQSPQSFGRPAGESQDVLLSPEGLWMTEALAEKAVLKEQLGSHRHPDLLAVSFSNFDYVGHVFGPNSLEMEELTVHADRVLSAFLNFLQNKVPGGLQNVALVLTSDHGAPPEPIWAQSEKLPAGRVDLGALGDKIERTLTQKFGKLKADAQWIRFELDLSYFVNPEALAARKVSLQDVAREIKTILLQEPSIAVAYTAQDVAEKKISGLVFERQALKTHYLGRSGDVVAVPKPYFMSGKSPVNHQTGYSYDRGVPLLLYGKRFRTGVYAEPADTVDIAPTLSFLLGVLPPSLSEGRILTESLAH